MLGRQSSNKVKLSVTFHTDGLALIHKIGPEQKEHCDSQGVSKPESIRLERCIDLAPKSLPIFALLTVGPPFLSGLVKEKVAATEEKHQYSAFSTT